MEHVDRLIGLPEQSPFEGAASFGRALPFQYLPGWELQVVHDGEHTYIVCTDGEHSLIRQATAVC